jgi:hypothetical protein
MIRTLAAVGLFASLTLAGGATAQTWGQPVYVGPAGRIVGGTPLSEFETRSYVNTGRWADGYSDPVYVHVPAPVHGYGRGPRGYGHSYDRRGHGHGYGRHVPRVHQGYRDVWGYNDDRHPSARGWSRDRRHRDDGYCGCGDVYLYDR